MPAFVTHDIFAKEMIPFIKKASVIDVNDNAVSVGAQGPDIFFFHRVFPWLIGKTLRKCGSALHRSSPAKLFDTMEQYCKIAPDQSVAVSYAYGFICHYALDRNCHPYVYFLQNKMSGGTKAVNPHTAHNTVEFAMDSYILSEHKGVTEPEKFRSDTVFALSENEKTEIGNMLSYTLNKVINKTISPKQCVTAIDDTLYTQRACYDPGGIKKSILSVLDIITAPLSNNFKLSAMLRPKDLEKAKKYANIEHNKWSSPFAKGTRRESFDDLYEMSLSDAKNMITAFIKGENGEAFTGNKSFLTGVEIQ